jgi:hypothetical protein
MPIYPIVTCKLLRTAIAENSNRTGTALIIIVVFGLNFGARIFKENTTKATA